MSSLVVRPVLEDHDLLQFVRVPRRVFRNVDSWLPAPEADELTLFDRDRNLFFEHAEVELFLAERGEAVVGRIAAFVDHGADDAVGFFGFFDVIEDADAAAALLNAAGDWCKARDCSLLRGPIDFWAVLSAGVMLEGFEHPNYVGFRHAMRYYSDYLEAAEFAPHADLAVWEYGHRPFPAPARGIANAVWANPSLEAHHFDPRSDEDWGEVADLYARAYVEHHWYYPMSAAELRLIAAGRVEPAISYIVRLDGAPVAMAIAIVNETQSSLRVAGMVPPEPVQRVWRTTQRARTWRQWLFAVVPEYRGRTIGGLGTALYGRVRDAAEIAGYERGEAAWTALVAERLRDGLGVLGAHQYKTFRVYQRDL